MKFLKVIERIEIETDREFIINKDGLIVEDNKNTRCPVYWIPEYIIKTETDIFVYATVNQYFDGGRIYLNRYNILDSIISTEVSKLIMKGVE